MNVSSVCSLTYRFARPSGMARLICRRSAPVLVTGLRWGVGCECIRKVCPGGIARPRWPESSRGR